MVSHPYRTYGDYLASIFPGTKVQKLTVNMRLSCPNRDGTIGRGGCSYCNNASFSPALGSDEEVTAQLEAGKRFFGRKYPAMRYLAYFQSYTNTHGDHTKLLDAYAEALGVGDVLGLVIGTRPDCVDASLLADIKGIAGGRYVMMEYGAESCRDDVLRRVNRCHTVSDTERAVALTRQAGLHTGIHMICGLPGDADITPAELCGWINTLGVDTVKFHQLQLIKGTPLEHAVSAGTERDATIYTVDRYLDLCCALVGLLDPGIAIERFVSQAPDRMLAAPCWGLKNYQFTDRLNSLLSSRAITQGCQNTTTKHEWLPATTHRSVLHCKSG